VFDHPANAFVMDFLGNVNVFHGRVHGGKGAARNLEVEYPHESHADSQGRPRLRAASRAGCQPRTGRRFGRAGKIVQINPAGSVAKVRVLSEEFGLALNVDLPLERYGELQLQVGEIVYVVPRRVRFLSASRLRDLEVSVAGTLRVPSAVCFRLWPMGTGPADCGKRVPLDSVNGRCPTTKLWQCGIELDLRDTKRRHTECACYLESPNSPVTPNRL